MPGMTGQPGQALCRQPIRVAASSQLPSTTSSTKGLMVMEPSTVNQWSAPSRRALCPAAWYGSSRLTDAGSSTATVRPAYTLRPSIPGPLTRRASRTR